MDVDETLIEEVRNHTLSYDLGQPDYKNLTKKECACFYDQLLTMLLSFSKKLSS